MKHPIIFYFLVIFLFSNCSQLAIFHSARTEGKGNLSFSPSLEGFVFRPFASSGGDLGVLGLPGIRAELNYGITNSTDIVSSFYSSGAFLTSLKMRFIGTNESPFSISVMPGYEYQFNLLQTSTASGKVNRLHLPIIASFYTTENIGFSIGTKYVLQIEENGDNVSFPGINAGINIDRRIKYTIGGGLFLPFRPLTGTEGFIFQFGVSAKIPLYTND